MFSIYICDDQENYLNFYQSLINDYIVMENLCIESVTAYTCPKQLLSRLSAHNLPSSGLYFLDIDLNHEINGIKLAEKIREFDPRGFIVFITAHERYMSDTLSNNVEPLRFIKKGNPDCTKEQMLTCINVAFERYSTSANTMQKTFHFATREKIFVLEFHEIICFQITTPHKIKLCTINSIFFFSGELSNLEPLLDDYFFRSHPSCIINLSHIREYTPKTNTLIMKDEIRCPVSIRNKKKLQDIIKKKC